MVAAIRLNLFDAIPLDRGATFAEIVARTNTSAKGMDALLDVMLAARAVTYDDKTLRFYNELDKSGSWGKKWREDLLGWSVSMQRQMFYIPDSVRQGRAVGLTEVLGDYESLYEARSDLPEVAKDWDPWMSNHHEDISKQMSFIYQMPTVEARIGKHSKRFDGTVLDWCGNTGSNSIQLAKMDPTMKLTVLDLPTQVAKAEIAIKAEGLQDQIDTMGVDLYDANLTFDHKYDAVLMISMLREWSWADTAYFFKIIHSLLNSGGVITMNMLSPHAVGKNYTNEIGFEGSIYSVYFLASASHDQIPKAIDDLTRMLLDVGFVDPQLHGDKWLAAVKP